MSNAATPRCRAADYQTAAFLRLNGAVFIHWLFRYRAYYRISSADIAMNGGISTMPNHRRGLMVWVHRYYRPRQSATAVPYRRL